MRKHIYPHRGKLSDSSFTIRNGAANGMNVTISCRNHLSVFTGNIIIDRGGFSILGTSHLDPGNDATTDNCLSVLNFHSMNEPICMDLDVEIAYTLDTQTDVQRMKAFRFLLTSADRSRWFQQALDREGSTCSQFVKH